MIKRLLASAFLIAIVGCGEKTGTIEGTVTAGGQPLKNYNVTFTFKEGGMENNSAAAKTDDNGHYVVEKVPMGELQISISPVGVLSEQAKLDKEARARLMSTGQPLPVPKEAPKSLVSEIYNDPVTSGLTFTLDTKKATHNIVLP